MSDVAVLFVLGFFGMRYCAELFLAVDAPADSVVAPADGCSGGGAFAAVAPIGAGVPSAMVLTVPREGAKFAPGRYLATTSGGLWPLSGHALYSHEYVWREATPRRLRDGVYVCRLTIVNAVSRVHT